MDLFKIFGSIGIKGVKEVQNDLKDTTNQAEKASNSITGAFKKIGQSVTGAFKSNAPQQLGSNLETLSNKIVRQENHLTVLKQKYQDLYLTQGKNSDEARKCAKEIEDLSDELRQNKERLIDAENAADKFDNQLNDTSNQAERSSNKMGDAFRKLGRIIVTVFAIDKIKDFGQKLVSTAGEVMAENAQFEASFADMADTATEMFNRVGEATGVFASRLKVTGTKAYSQLKGAGMEANEALQKTEVFLNLASDAAAYYDISLEDAEARIRSFMRGNVEAGDAIGLFTSESQRNSYALEMYGKKWLELNEAERQNLMLAVAENIYKQSGAIGQAQREADGLANVTGNLKEVWRQFLATVGEPVLNAVIPIMQRLTEKLKDMKSWVESNKESFQRIGDVIATVVDKVWNLGASVVQLIGWFGEHKTITTVLITVMSGLAAAIAGYHGTVKVVTTATQMWTTVQKLLNAELTLNPIGLVIAAIAALVAILVVVYKNSEQFRESVNKLWGTIKENLITVFENLQPALQAVGELFKSIWSVIQEHVLPAFTKIATAVTDLLNFLSPIISAIVSLFTNRFGQALSTITSIVTSIVNLISGVVSKVRAVVEPIYNAVMKPINAIRQGVSNAMNWIKNAIKLPHFKVEGSLNPLEWFSGKFPKVRVEWYAEGGVMTRPTLFGVNPATGNAMVGGEAGAEAIAPISTLQQYVSEAVKAETDGITYYLEKLISLLGVYLPDIRDNMGKSISLDGKELVNGIVDRMDNALGVRIDKKARFGV